MTDDDQEARSMKFERQGSVTIRQLKSGNFAMYHIGGVGSPFWIGPSEGILGAYNARPPITVATYIPPAPKRAAGIDLSKLEITL